MPGPEEIKAAVNAAELLQQALTPDLSAFVMEYLPDEILAGVAESVPQNLPSKSNDERQEIAKIKTSLGKWRKVQKQKAEREKEEAEKQAEKREVRFDESSRIERALKLRYGLNTQTVVDTYALAKNPPALSLELQTIEKTISEEVVVTARDIDKIFSSHSLRYIEHLGYAFFINNIRKILLSPQSLVLMHILEKKNFEAFCAFLKESELTTQTDASINNFIAVTIRRVQRIQDDYRDADVAAGAEVDNDNANLRASIPEKLRKLMLASSPYERAHRTQVLEWLQDPAKREKLQKDLSFSQWIAFQEYALTHLNMHLPERVSFWIQMKRGLRSIPLSSKYFIFSFAHHMKKPFFGMLALWLTAILLIVLLSVIGIITPVLSLIQDFLSDMFNSLFWSSVIFGGVASLRAYIFGNYDTVDTIARAQIAQSDALRNKPGCSLEGQIQYLEIKIKYLRLLHDSYEKQKEMYGNNRLIYFVGSFAYSSALMMLLTSVPQTVLYFMGILIFVVPSPISTIVTIMGLLIPIVWGIYKTYQLWHRATLAQAELSAASNTLTEKIREKNAAVLVADEKVVPPVKSASAPKDALFWHPEEKEVAPEYLREAEAEEYKKFWARDEGLEADLPKVSATPKPAEKQVRDYLVPTASWRPTWNATPMIRAFHFFNHYCHLVRLKVWKENNPDHVEFYYPQPNRDANGRVAHFTDDEKVDHYERQKILKRCLFSISRGEEQLEKFKIKILLFKHHNQNILSEEERGEVRRFIKKHLLSQEEKACERTIDLLCGIFLGQKLPKFKENALEFLQAFLAKSRILGEKITYQEMEKIDLLMQAKMRGRGEITQTVFFDVLAEALKEYFGMQLPTYLKKYRADLERTVVLTENGRRIKKTTWKYERDEKEIVEDLDTKMSRIEKEKNAELEKMIDALKARWSNRFDNRKKMSMEDLFHAFYEEDLSYKRLPEDFFPEKISYKSLLQKFLKFKNYIKEIPKEMDNRIPREYHELKEKMVSVMGQLREMLLNDRYPISDVASNVFSTGFLKKLHQEELSLDPLFKACFSDDVLVEEEPSGRLTIT